jgi:hypothetical protein
MSVPTLSGNNQLSIQGVHCSNIGGTPIISQFPTAPTGNSQGLYHFTNVDPEGNKKTDYLNCSADQAGGGFNWWHSSSTQAPSKLLTVDRNATQLETKLKNKLETTVLDMANNTLKLVDASGNTQLLNVEKNHIRMVSTSASSDIYPYSIKVDDSNFIDQATCYSNLQVPSQNYGTGLEIANTNSKVLAIANPNQPALLLSNQGQNIYNELTINNLSMNDGSKRTVFLNGNDQSLTLYDGSNNCVLSSSDLTFNGVSIFLDLSQSEIDISQLQKDVSQNTFDISQNKQDISQLQIDVSQTQQDVSKNTFDISNNTASINAINLKLPQQIVSQLVFSSPAIYADSSVAPQQNSTFQTTYGYFGWAYKKASPQASNAKINWYFPFPILNGTVGQLKGLYYQIFNNCASSGDLGFLTVYTKPTGTNDYRPWYHSSMTYVASSNSPANQTCQMFMNIKNLNYTPNSVNIQNQISMIQSPVSNPKGDYQDDQQVLFIVFGTNSASSLNNVDFACTKIGVITDNYTTEYLLM